MSESTTRSVAEGERPETVSPRANESAGEGVVGWERKGPLTRGRRATEEPEASVASRGSQRAPRLERAGAF
ncbi:hypothetical protein [Natronobacterium gregoryi]|uniref:hypothetical protein n=1 Tax=Natronobacterium gregoryi TaxID=44930 RepID=UPI0014614951|nr:hypothetical protein [Natronobacterium gregoryi]